MTWLWLKLVLVLGFDDGVYRHFSSVAFFVYCYYSCCCRDDGDQVYSSPRQLPCVHTFCLPCLERVGVEKRAGDVVVCPLCRHEFRLPVHGFVGLPRNTFVEELAEVSTLCQFSVSCVPLLHVYLFCRLRDSSSLANVRDSPAVSIFYS